jgi:hypothetical protein
VQDLGEDRKPGLPRYMISRDLTIRTDDKVQHNHHHPGLRFDTSLRRNGEKRPDTGYPQPAETIPQHSAKCTNPPLAFSAAVRHAATTRAKTTHVTPHAGIPQARPQARQLVRPPGPTPYGTTGTFPSQRHIRVRIHFSFTPLQEASSHWQPKAGHLAHLLRPGATIGIGPGKAGRTRRTEPDAMRICNAEVTHGKDTACLPEQLAS